MVPWQSTFRHTADVHQTMPEYIATDQCTKMIPHVFETCFKQGNPNEYLVKGTKIDVCCYPQGISDSYSKQLVNRIEQAEQLSTSTLRFEVA